MALTLKLLGITDMVAFIKSLLFLLLLLGAALGIAGDFRWVTINNHDTAYVALNQKITLTASEQTTALRAVTRSQQKMAADLSLELARFRIANLDARITFLRIKVQQNEATTSEKIILPTLERQLRELKDNLPPAFRN